MVVKYKTNSNYSQTPSTTRYLSLYNPRITQENLSQETKKVFIENKYNRRPDLLAFDLFGDSRLWWVIVHYNRDKLKDPINDLVPGLEIVVPKKYSTTGVL